MVLKEQKGERCFRQWGKYDKYDGTDTVPGAVKTVRRLNLGKAMSSQRKEELKAYSSKMWRMGVGDGSTVRGCLAFKSILGRWIEC